MGPHHDRSLILLRAARDFLAKLEGDWDDALSTVVFYDEADCDGQCLLNDLDIHLGLKSHTPPLRGTWDVSADHPILRRPHKRFHVQRDAEAYRDRLVFEGFENVTITPET